jgi:hypothetical protein
MKWYSGLKSNPKMIPNQNLDEKIKKIKDKIADIREYISSDFCTNCIEMYNQRKILEQELKDLEDERNRQS